MQAIDLLRGLARVVTPARVRLDGVWEKTHEPGAPDILHHRYRGWFSSDVPLVGLSLLCGADQVDWGKAIAGSPPVPPPPPFAPSLRLEIDVLGWCAATRRASVVTRLHHMVRGTMVENLDEPTASCTIETTEGATGVPFVILRLPGLVYTTVLLHRADVRVGRGRIWRLRRRLADPLAPALARWMTRGRTGRFRSVES